MSDADKWTIAISGVALVVSIAGLALSLAWRRADRKAVSDLRDEVDKQRARVKVQKLITEWQNSILSGQYAVQDDNWRGLLDRATKWRTSLAGELEDLQRHTGGQRTRAYVLLQETVDPAKRFETRVRPLVDRWEHQPDSEAKYQAKLEVVTAISELQQEFNKALLELVVLSDDQLMKPVT